MKKYIKCVYLLLFTLPVMIPDSFGGDQVSVRLVEVSSKGSVVDPAVKDVESMLKNQLAFSNYSLIDRKEFQLPADETLRMAKNYVVTCRGKQSDLTIGVKRGSRNLLQTTVALKDGKPLILGGFPNGNSKILLVLLVQ